MIVYWDLVAGFNLIVDYLLLLGASHLAGRTLPKLRLIGASAFGAAFAVAQLMLPHSPVLTVVSFSIMAALAFYGTGRAVKLSALTLLLACVLGGTLLLLSESCGNLAHFSRGILYAELPWKMFFLAGISIFIACRLIFFGAAEHTKSELVKAELSLQGRNIPVILLRDSGNLLFDTQTGKEIIVVGESALAPLLQGLERDAVIRSPVAVTTVGSGSELLNTIVCDNVTVNGCALGPRRIAIAPTLFGDGGFQGRWRGEGDTVG